LLEVPRFLRVFGWLNIVLGLILPVINFLVVIQSINKLQQMGLSSQDTIPLWINIWVYVILGILLMVAGWCLVGPARAGRILCVIWAVLSVVALFIAVVDTAILRVIVEEKLKGQSYYIQIFTAAPAMSPGYGILLTVMMFIPPTRRWVRAVRAVQRGEAPEEIVAAAAGPPVSKLAVASMVLSMIPFMLLTQLTGLILGLVALGKIRRSQGALGGRGFAWTGVIISSLILFCCGGLIGVAIVGSQMDENNRKKRTSGPDYYYVVPDAERK
jgi:hypothetical protein